MGALSLGHGFLLQLQCKWTAFIWTAFIKHLYPNLCLAFTRSHTHSHTNGDWLQGTNQLVGSD